MGKILEGVEYKKELSTDCVDSESSDYMLVFDKGSEYFLSYEARQRLIQSTKSLIRGSKRYSMFKSKILRRIDHCQINPNFNIDNECTLEMHHGPIFEMAEIIDIVIDYFLLHNKKVTSFSIANQVLSDHEDGLVQVMILSKTGHEIVTNRLMPLNLNQFIGDVSKFIKKYDEVISGEKKEYYNRIVLSSKYENTDNGIFSTDKLYNRFVEDMEE